MGHWWEEGMAQKLDNSEFLFDLDASRFFWQSLFVHDTWPERLPSSLFFIKKTRRGATRQD
jgi:hypothetical protein